MPSHVSSFHTEPDSVYILITQCLQNNFFLAHENRLCLPDDIAMRLLVSGKSKLETKDMYKLEPPYPNRRKVSADLLKNGPLYQFLESTIDDPNRLNDVHVIHIKDWHKPSRNYDTERRSYGSHCEAGTWEANPIDGFDKYLQPWKGLPGARKQAQSMQGFRDEKTVYYEILSDSLFDFRPEVPGHPSLLAEILHRLIFGDGMRTRRVYIVVVGVMTDIKIKTLLTSLRSLCHLDNLILSDVLSAASTLERHLSGLDYADKVLNVEIIHSLNDLVSVLNPYHADRIAEEVISHHVDFRQYRSYYLDKQNVLAYQDQKLIQYLELTSKRGTEVYEQVFKTNKYLTWFGLAFLVVTVILGTLRFLDPSRFSLDVVVLTGGLSMTQLLAGFFYNPLNRLQENLNNLVQLRTQLETHSTVTALLRHHLTMPENLQNEDLQHLREQMSIVQDVASKASSSVSQIHLSADGDTPLSPDLS
jgi:nicotinamidase-related amidase